VSGLSLLLLLLLATRSWYSRCELGGETVHLLWDGEGRWWWRQEEEENEMQLYGDSYLSPAMIVLNLREAQRGRVRSLVLFPSCIGEALFRRLAVRLKLEGRPRQPAPDAFTNVK
jgi:hypothetical protein